MANKHASLYALFADIADAIREKTGDTATIVADDFPDVIRERLQAAPPPPYLTFSSPSSFTLKVYDTTKHWDGTLEYSTDPSSWSTWDGATTLSSATSGSDNVLYLRGTGNTVITGDNVNHRWLLTGSDIACIGNIENLLDYATVESGAHPTMAKHCYLYMFYDCKALTQAPALPATTLAIGCYGSMFYGCTSLTQAPALPATTLMISCYSSMFRNCASLTQAPALPATTLTGYCYSQMFQGCTSLTQAPALPATRLMPNCYRSMFSGCTSLTQAPALPATTLDNYCYQSMFSGCTKIKLSSTRTGEYTVEYRIPTIGTGTTATDALTNMFTDTGGTFKGTPEINTTYYLSNTNEVIVGPTPYLTFSSPSSFTLKVYDTTKHWDGTLEYSTDPSSWSTWDGATTLSSATSGSDNVLYLRGTGNTKITGNSTDYRWVITGTDISCIGNIENLLDYATVQSGAHPTMTDYCYYRMFQGCTSLTQAPALPATMLAGDCYSSMFASCTALTQAPALPATTLANDCYFSMFRDCTSLIQAPALPATTLVTNCYSQMFYGCTSLAQAPALPATTLAEGCYQGMFASCTALTQAPALPATTLANDCYFSMFRDCTSLIQAPALPATTLVTNCYSQMFYGCTGLIQAPALPATTLADSCYKFMFRGCTSLTQAPALPATTLASDCYKNMFSGCKALTQAPALPATTLTSNCYNQMFYGCTGLIQAPALPATTLAIGCYWGMFNRCTNLTQAPSLPATTLAESCYRFMFEFTAITAIPRIMARTYATDSCKGMFDDIKTLNVYSSSGPGHTYGWTAPASTYCSGMFGSDDSQSEWAKLDGSNFPNSGTPTEGVTYYFETVS